MKTALFTTGLLGMWLLAKGGPPPSSAGVDLQWDYDFEGNTNATSFLVYWGTSSGVYQSIQTAWPVTSNTVSGLNKNTTYFFNVKVAANDGSVSDFAEEVSIITPKK